MKKIIYSLLVAMFLFVGCETIEDRDEMGVKLTPDEISIEAYNTTPGGNEIVVVNNTPHVAGLWNLLVDKSNRKQDTVLIPFLGTQTLSFTATTAGGLVTVTKDVEITTIDHPLAPQWAFLAGSGTDGKTWVWSFDHPDGSAYGNGGYLGNVSPGWWKCSEADLTGWGVNADEMTFDLNGGPNFTLITGNTEAGDGLAAGTYTGSFKFDMTKTKLDGNNNPWAIGNLILDGATISRGFKPNEGKGLIYSFDILKLTDDELVLSYPEAGAGAWGTAWFWMFKREGYIFPAK